MNTALLSAFLPALAWIAAPGLSAAVAVGSTREEIVAELGTPVSRMALGDFEEMTYPRGTVTLEGGVVTKLNLLTPKEWHDRTVRQRVELRNRAAEDAALRQEDDAALARLTASPAWTAADADTRLAMLDRLAATNPYADTGTLRVAVESRSARIADRSVRIASSERRAAVAEASAKDAESRARVAEINAAEAANNARNNTVSVGVTYVVAGGFSRYGSDLTRNRTPVAPEPVYYTSAPIGAHVATPPAADASARPKPAGPAVASAATERPWAAHRDIPKAGPPESQKR